MPTLNAPLRIPIDPLSHYGYRFKEREDQKGRFHPGVDLNGPGAGNADKGMNVYSIGPGVVTFIDVVGPNLGWGKLMYVKHDMEQYFASFGVDRPDWCPASVFSQYAHLLNIEVTVGQEVDQETILGQLGGTPYWSAHLHHEIRKRPLGEYYYPGVHVTEEQMDDMYFDPIKFVDRVNTYILQQRAPARPTSRLIKSEKQPEVFVYNGKMRFHVPNESTAYLLFGPDWGSEIEVVDAKMLKGIKEGDPIPNMQP